MAAAQRDLRVMVVDDNVDAANSLCTLLQLLGCETASAYDGATGIEVAATLVPDLCFIDLDMPGMDGCELVRRLRQLQQVAACRRFICLTARSGADSQRRCLEAGFDQFVTKPIDDATLRRALDCGRPL